MKVGELIEELQAYGDHLTVIVVDEEGSDDKRFDIDQVMANVDLDGMAAVAITIQEEAL